LKYVIKKEVINMAMKKKGGGVSAPEPTATSGQMKMAQRAVKNPATLKKVATGGKGATAPKPTASSGQVKIAQRPIKVLGKIGTGKGKK
jgi:hypothetical protein